MKKRGSKVCEIRLKIENKWITLSFDFNVNEDDEKIQNNCSQAYASSNFRQCDCRPSNGQSLVVASKQSKLGFDLKTDDVRLSLQTFALKRFQNKRTNASIQNKNNLTSSSQYFS